MFKKKYIVIAVGIVSILLGSLFVNNVLLAQSSGEYDPWIDYNEDGIIDVNDLHPLGQAYGSSGDPTKNVNVTNWPISTEVVVWDFEILIGETVQSDSYYANGFGHLHVLIDIFFDLGQTIVVRLYAEFAQLVQRPVLVYAQTFNTSYSEAAITIPVPSEKFHFQATVPSGSVYVSLSFYLTWA